MANDPGRARGSRGSGNSRDGRMRGRGGRAISTRPSASHQAPTSIVGSHGSQANDLLPLAAAPSPTTHASPASHPTPPTRPTSSSRATTSTPATLATGESAAQSGIYSWAGMRDPTDGRIWLRPEAKLDFYPPDGPQKQIS